MSEPRLLRAGPPPPALHPGNIWQAPLFDERLALGEIARSICVVRALSALEPRDVVARRPPAADGTLVTLVLPMFNAREWIDLCLTGVLAQAHANLEVLCVDDASTDDTYERVV